MAGHVERAGWVRLVAPQSAFVGLISPKWRMLALSERLNESDEMAARPGDWVHGENLAWKERLPPVPPGVGRYVNHGVESAAREPRSLTGGPCLGDRDSGVSPLRVEGRSGDAPRPAPVGGAKGIEDADLTARRTDSKSGVPTEERPESCGGDRDDGAGAKEMRSRHTRSQAACVHTGRRLKVRVREFRAGGRVSGTSGRATADKRTDQNDQGGGDPHEFVIRRSSRGRRLPSTRECHPSCGSPRPFVKPGCGRADNHGMPVGTGQRIDRIGGRTP